MGAKNMTELEAIRARHTVRKFLDRAIPAEAVRQLDELIAGQNARYGLRMRLVTENADAFGGLLRLVLAKGARNYIALVGKNGSRTEEQLGYCGIQAALLAQRLGLNSWWVAATYQKKAVAQIVGLQPDEVLTGIIVLGYGATPGTPHKSKRPEEVSTYRGEAPQWFHDGVAAALLAPTALNHQSFRLTGEAGRVRLSVPEGSYLQTDLGIVRYHFEIGAGVENFTWEA